MIIIVLLFLLFPISLFAAIPPIPTGQGYGFDDFLAFIYNFGNFFYTLAGVLVGLALIWSGYTFLTAGGDSAKAKKAKDILKNGLIGAFLLFGVGTLVSTVRQIGGNPAGFFGGGSGSGGGAASYTAYGCDANGQCVATLGGIFAEPTCSNQCSVSGQAISDSCYDCTSQGSTWCLADSTCIIDELDCPGVFTKISGGCP